MSTTKIYDDKRKRPIRGIEIMVFDLDGTLIDSRKVIIDSVNHALESLGMDKKGDNDIIKYVGTGTHDLLKNVSGLDEEDLIEDAVDLFQKKWEENMIRDSRLFPHVKQVLDHFSCKDMMISSNAGREIILRALRHFKIKKYFNQVMSGDGDCIKPSACPLEKMIQLDTIRQHSIMIGDMAVDIKAGKNAGMKTCAVAYGMGDPDKLQQEGPDIMVDDLRELIDIIE